MSFVNSSLVSLFFLLNLNIFSACVDKTEEGIEKYPVTYYLDSNNGIDESDGLSEENAWKSLERVMQTKLIPGDEIRIKRGSEFNGTLIINDSGTSDNPILLTEYGNENLKAPAFTNPYFEPQNNQFGNCIRLKGSYIIVENMYCYNTVADLPQDAGGFLTMWELGAIYIDKNAQNCIVRNNELYNCGVGIKSYGPYAKIENNYIHDCNRVLKLWGWGPLAIWLGGDNQEVSYNRIINYKAVDPNITWGPDSYGGGADGGAIEIDDARYPKSNISIHHNYSSDCQGFIEVTWTDVAQNPPYFNFSIHHNVSDDYQQFVAIWRGANFKIENNTIIRRKKNVNDWGVFNITQNNAKHSIRNNIIVLENEIEIFKNGNKGTAKPNNIIENNLYWAASGELKIGSEGPGVNYIIDNPKLQNYIKGNSPTDFSLTATSPAIDSGLNLGYINDFENKAISRGKASDIGAFEY
ncbi:MAG: hypothetical protein IPL55_07500 [Saprospiraceae bacterium]|nr:hypothetical protein [Saprospiraceae bacterium]